MQADAALRRAKIEGRDRIVLHEPAEDVGTRSRPSRLELDLARAPLANGQMHLVYQPYVDLATAGSAASRR